MSTPNAAAVAALIWSARPTWTSDQVAAQLLATADSLDSQNPTYAGLPGTGKVNSYNALMQTIAPPKIKGVTEIVGSTIGAINKLTVRTVSRFDEATIEAAGNRELRSDVADGLLDTGDDVVVIMTHANDNSVGTFGLKMVVDVDTRAGVSQSAGEADAPAGNAFWASIATILYCRRPGRRAVFRISPPVRKMVDPDCGDAAGHRQTRNRNGERTAGGHPGKDGYDLRQRYATWPDRRFSSRRREPVRNLRGIRQPPLHLAIPLYRVLMAKQPDQENESPEIPTVTAVWPGDTPEERKVNETSNLYEMAVRVSRDEMKRMPRTVGELVFAPADAKPGQWPGIYQFRNGLPDDRWGRPYRMRSPGRYADDFVDLWSAGPDGRDGTGDDIGNWVGAKDEERIVNGILSRLSSAAYNFKFHMKRPLRDLDELFTAPATRRAAENGSVRTCSAKVYRMIQGSALTVAYSRQA
jgi:general secretion pathway protein G